MKNGKSVRRGCCPPVAGIYRAVNEDPRVEPIVGTAREIGDRIGNEANYIRALARSGRYSKNGWRIETDTPTPRTGKAGRPGAEYIAERPDDDPIIGPVEEIAALTGLHPTSVAYLIRSGGKSREGWTVRPVDGADRGFDIPPDPAVE